MMLKLLIAACLVTHGLGRPDVSHILKKNQNGQQKNKSARSLQSRIQVKNSTDVESRAATDNEFNVFDYLAQFNGTLVNDLGTRWNGAQEKLSISRVGKRVGNRDRSFRDSVKPSPFKKNTAEYGYTYEKPAVPLPIKPVDPFDFPFNPDANLIKPVSTQAPEYLPPLEQGSLAGSTGSVTPNPQRAEEQTVVSSTQQSTYSASTTEGPSSYSSTQTPSSGSVTEKPQSGYSPQGTAVGSDKQDTEGSSTLKPATQDKYGQQDSTSNPQDITQSSPTPGIPDGTVDIFNLQGSTAGPQDGSQGSTLRPVTQDTQNGLNAQTTTQDSKDSYTEHVSTLRPQGSHQGSQIPVTTHSQNEYSPQGSTSRPVTQDVQETNNLQESTPGSTSSPVKQDAQGSNQISVDIFTQQGSTERPQESFNAQVSTVGPFTQDDSDNTTAQVPLDSYNQLSSTPRPQDSYNPQDAQNCYSPQENQIPVDIYKEQVSTASPVTQSPQGSTQDPAEDFSPQGPAENSTGFNGYPQASSLSPISQKPVSQSVTENGITGYSQGPSTIPVKQGPSTPSSSNGYSQGSTSAPISQGSGNQRPTLISSTSGPSTAVPGSYPSAAGSPSVGSTPAVQTTVGGHSTTGQSFDDDEGYNYNKPEHVLPPNLKEVIGEPEDINELATTVSPFPTTRKFNGYFIPPKPLSELTVPREPSTAQTLGETAAPVTSSAESTTRPTAGPIPSTQAPEYLPPDDANKPEGPYSSTQQPNSDQTLSTEAPSTSYTSPTVGSEDSSTPSGSEELTSTAKYPAYNQETTASPVTTSASSGYPGLNKETTTVSSYPGLNKETTLSSSYSGSNNESSIATSYTSSNKETTTAANYPTSNQETTTTASYPSSHQETTTGSGYPSQESTTFAGYSSSEFSTTVTPATNASVFTTTLSTASSTPVSEYPTTTKSSATFAPEYSTTGQSSTYEPFDSTSSEALSSTSKPNFELLYSTTNIPSSTSAPEYLPPDADNNASHNTPSVTNLTAALTSTAVPTTAVPTTAVPTTSEYRPAQPNRPNVPSDNLVNQQTPQVDNEITMSSPSTPSQTPVDEMAIISEINNLVPDTKPNNGYLPPYTAENTGLRIVVEDTTSSELFGFPSSAGPALARLSSTVQDMATTYHPTSSQKPKGVDAAAESEAEESELLPRVALVATTSEGYKYQVPEEKLSSPVVAPSHTLDDEGYHYKVPNVPFP